MISVTAGGATPPSTVARRIEMKASPRLDNEVRKYLRVAEKHPAPFVNQEPFDGLPVTLYPAISSNSQSTSVGKVGTVHSGSG